jgi:hypothetical protein
MKRYKLILSVVDEETDRAAGSNALVSAEDWAMTPEAISERILLPLFAGVKVHLDTRAEAEK